VWPSAIFLAEGKSATVASRVASCEGLSGPFVSLISALNFHLDHIVSALTDCLRITPLLFALATAIPQAGTRARCIEGCG
jgi:hypothetical protein